MKRFTQTKTILGKVTAEVFKHHEQIESETGKMWEKIDAALAALPADPDGYVLTFDKDTGRFGELVIGAGGAEHRQHSYDDDGCIDGWSLVNLPDLALRVVLDHAPKLAQLAAEDKIFSRLVDVLADSDFEPEKFAKFRREIIAQRNEALRPGPECIAQDEEEERE